MNKEPEPLSREELLRVENIQLRRELLNQQDQTLLRDIAHAHMLEVADFGKTWVVNEGRIILIEAPAEVAQAAAGE